MTKHRLMNEQIHALISDPEVSDESIHVLYHFLSDLLEEFETQAFCRLRRYQQEQEEIAAAQRP